MIKKLLLTVASGAMLLAPVALADHETPVPCHSGCKIELVSRRVWIPARFRTVSERHFIPAEYTTVCDRRWVPARYCWRSIAVRGHCGMIIGYRRVRERVPGTGRFEMTMRRELVPGTGRWTTRTRHEQIPGTGRFVVRTERKVVCRVEQFVFAPLRATGAGAPREGLSGERARLLALRAARLDAARKLAEQLFGLKIRAGTTVKDLVLSNDLIASEVEGLVRRAREVAVRERDAGTFEVTLEIDAAALRALVAAIG